MYHEKRLSLMLADNSECPLCDTSAYALKDPTTDVLLMQTTSKSACSLESWPTLERGRTTNDFDSPPIAESTSQTIPERTDDF
jgi:hypothetical protein